MVLPSLLSGKDSQPFPNLYNVSPNHSDVSRGNEPSSTLKHLPEEGFNLFGAWDLGALGPFKAGMTSLGQGFASTEMASLNSPPLTGGDKGEDVFYASFRFPAFQRGGFT